MRSLCFLLLLPSLAFAGPAPHAPPPGPPISTLASAPAAAPAPSKSAPSTLAARIGTSLAHGVSLAAKWLSGSVASVTLIHITFSAVGIPTSADFGLITNRPPATTQTSVTIP